MPIILRQVVWSFKAVVNDKMNLPSKSILKFVHETRCIMIWTLQLRRSPKLCPLPLYSHSLLWKIDLLVLSSLNIEELFEKIAHRTSFFLNMVNVYPILVSYLYYQLHSPRHFPRYEASWFESPVAPNSIVLHPNQWGHINPIIHSAFYKNVRETDSNASYLQAQWRLKWV